MAYRFNPPPTWPPPPQGWTPPPGWQPDPSWGPPPAGWQLWVYYEPPPPPGMPPSYSPQAPLQPWYERGPKHSNIPIYIIVGVSVLALLAWLVVSVLADADDARTGRQSASRATAAESAVTAETDGVGLIGMPEHVGGYAVTLSEVEIINGTELVAQVRIRNRSRAVLEGAAAQFELRESDGGRVVTVTPTTEWEISLQPGAMGSGYLVFKVSEQATPRSHVLRFTPGGSDTEARITWPLNL